MVNITNLSLIKNFIKQNKWTYLIGLVFMFISSYVQTLFPKVLGKTIDILKLNNFDVNKVKINIGLILLISIGTFISTYIWRNLVIGNARKLECHIREKLYDHFQKLSPTFYNKRKTGDLIAYAINDISAVRMTMGPSTAMTINGLVVCVASIYAMSQAINWRLTLMSLLPVPLIIFFMLKIGTLVQKRFRKVQENFSKISGRIQENISGIRVIKAYVQEESEIQNFEALNKDMMESNLSMVRLSSFLSPLLELCFSISFVLNLILGGNMVLKGTISLGDFIAFNTYLAMIMAPIMSIGRIITIWQRGMASIKRLDEIFNVKPDIIDGEPGLTQVFQGNIKINDLNFKYPGTDKNSLSHISLTIPKGHTLAVVGRTGSGKTTLVNLLLKMYNVENNKIYLDEDDINSYTLGSIREGIGYVPQDNFLFSASISDNICFFKACYDKEKITEATKASCIYDSIMELPQGFDTILGERGVNISGGQKQRVSIARAIIKNPPLLILDDSLSAVDSITEAKILANIKELRKDKTTLIIAHRLSAAKDADEIIVLDEGIISERGTHEELIKEGGLYYEIFMEQFKDTKSEAAANF